MWVAASMGDDAGDDWVAGALEEPMTISVRFVVVDFVDFVVVVDYDWMTSR